MITYIELQVMAQLQKHLATQIMQDISELCCEFMMKVFRHTVFAMLQPELQQVAFGTLLGKLKAEGMEAKKEKIKNFKNIF